MFVHLDSMTELLLRPASADVPMTALQRMTSNSKPPMDSLMLRSVSTTQHDIDSFEQEVPPDDDKSSKPMEIVVFTILWWIAIIAVQFVVKGTVDKDTGFYPYALAFTSFAQPLTGLLAAIVCCFQKKEVLPPWTTYEIMLTIVCGAIQGIENGVSNVALTYLTVSMKTMLSASSLLFQVITARLWGLEEVDLIRIVSGILVIIGGLFQAGLISIGPNSADDAKMSPDMVLGISMQVFGMALGAQRWAITAKSMTGLPKDCRLSKMSKFQLLAHWLPINGLVLWPIVWASESNSPGLYPENLLQIKLGRNLLLFGVALLVMLFAQMKVIAACGTVSFKVLATVQPIPLVAAGVYFNGDVVSEGQLIGFAFCLVSALVFGLGPMWLQRNE